MTDGYDRALESDVDTLTRMLMLAFGGTDAQHNRDWLMSVGLDTFRVVRDGGVAVGCAALIPMGQFFGGTSVPMEGVAGVAVSPEARGRGVATGLMTGMMHELHERGVPISTLYPATQPLYRRAGYEPAGHRFGTTIDVRRLGLRVNEPAVRAAAAGDLPGIKECARRYAAVHDGFLDRAEYIWNRILKTRDQKRDVPGLVVEGPEGIEGYVFYFQEHGGTLAARDDGQVAIVTDLVAETPAAAKRLVSVLGELSSMCSSASIRTGPIDPMLLLLPEIAFKTELLDHWMTRIVDVPGAIAARGYAPGINAEVHVEIEDDVIESNSGSWVICVGNGVGSAERGGRGAISMNVRQLASVYTGFVSPRQLSQVGLINGDDASLDSLGAMFAGPAPWMPDMF